MFLVQGVNMATSLPRAKANTDKTAVASPSTPKSAPPESEGSIFSLIKRRRVAVMASPICLAAIMIVLNMFAGQRVHAVIDFLTSIPQR
jgi:hypothetical protein